MNAVQLDSSTISNPSPLGKRVEDDHAIITWVARVLIVVPLVAFLLAFILHYWTLDLLFDTVASTMLITGLVVLLFQKPYFKHHAHLAQSTVDVIQQATTNAIENTSILIRKTSEKTVEKAVERIEKSSEKRILRGLVAGGDRVWKSIDENLIRNYFYYNIRYAIFTIEKDGSGVTLTLEASESIYNCSGKGMNFSTQRYHFSSDEPNPCRYLDYIIINGERYTGPDGICYRSAGGTVYAFPKGPDGKAIENVEISANSSTVISHRRRITGLPPRDFQIMGMRYPTEVLFVAVMQSADMVTHLLYPGNPGLVPPVENGDIQKQIKSLDLDKEQLEVATDYLSKLTPTKYPCSEYVLEGIMANASIIVEWKERGTTPPPPAS